MTYPYPADGSPTPLLILALLISRVSLKTAAKTVKSKAAASPKAESGTGFSFALPTLSFFSKEDDEAPAPKK